MLNNVYLVLGVSMLTWYGASTLFGWEYGNPRRALPPPVVIPGMARTGSKTTYFGRSSGGAGSSRSGSWGFGGGK
jgi:hypothetical protein